MTTGSPRRQRPLRRLVGLLPPPRDDAALRLGRAVRDLITGRAAPAPHRTDLDLSRLIRASDRIELGDPIGANAQLDGFPVDAPSALATRASDLRATAERMARIRGRSDDAIARLEDATAAVRSLRLLGHADPVVMPYYQHSPGNPFQDLLYSRAFEHGVATLPIREPGAALELLPLVADGTTVALHLHWVNRVLHGASSPADAHQRITAFLATLDRLRDGGGRLIWTVHNILPHDSALPDEEALLRQAIVDRADIVHTMAPGTPEAVADHFTIPPDKVLEVPLPGFEGAYEDVIGRDAARWSLGVEPDELVYLLLGGLKPYKGLTDLLDAWSSIPADGERRRLVIAGAPVATDESRRFVERAAADPTILLHPRQIPPADMQLFLNAADVAVLPYQRTLNSAVLMLVVSFGLPVIVPAVRGVGDLVTPDMSRTFDPGDPTSLASALSDATALRTEAARDAARRLAEASDPAGVSERFARGVVAMLRPEG